MIESAARISVVDSHRSKAVSACVTNRVLLKLNEIALCARVYLCVLWPYKKLRGEDRLLRGDPLPSPSPVFPGDRFKPHEILHLKAGQSACY